MPRLPVEPAGRVAGRPGVRPTPPRSAVRTCWVLKGNQLTVTARVYRYTHGVELVAEGKSAEDILRTQYFREDCAQLEALADEWRRALLAKGFWPVEVTTP